MKLVLGEEVQQSEDDKLLTKRKNGVWKEIIKLSGTTIFEIGCGTDMPQDTGLMMRIPGPALSHFCIREVTHLPQLAIGSDSFIAGYQNIKDEWGGIDIIYCHGFVEHMTHDSGLELLRCMNSCCRPDGTLLLSTPRAEKNLPRIYPWPIEELQTAFQETGWHWETYYKDAKLRFDTVPILDKERALFRQLGEYYTAEEQCDLILNDVWICRPKSAEKAEKEVGGS